MVVGEFGWEGRVDKVVDGGSQIQYSDESLSSKLPCHLGTFAGIGVNESVPRGYQPALLAQDWP